MKTVDSDQEIRDTVKRIIRKHILLLLIQATATGAIAGLAVAMILVALGVLR